MSTPHVSPRLARYAEAHFGRGVVDRLETLAVGGIHDNQDVERILTALVRVAEKDADGFAGAVALARLDWRDLLVSAGLAFADWPEHLDRILGRAVGETGRRGDGP